MIHVDRSVVSAPAIYFSERTQQERERVLAELREAQPDASAEDGGFLSKIRQSAASGRLRGRNLFLPDYVPLLWGAARPVLNELFHGKCAYCETSGEQVPLDVDLYRPRENARDLDGSSSSLHYAWLAYDWENTFLACSFCLRAKGNRFPVFAKRVALGEMDVGRLRDEYPLLLNPCLDTPLRHLWLQEDGMMMPRDEAGKYTIELLNLNRAETVNARATAWANADTVTRRALEEEQQKPEALLEALRDELHPRQPHLLPRSIAAFLALSRAGRTLDGESELSELLVHGTPYPTTRASVPPPEQPSRNEHGSFEEFISGDAIPLPGSKAEPVAWSDERTRQQAYSIEADTAMSKAAYFTSAKRIEHFTIRNFKAIDEISLPFPAPDGANESWLMLLGENGCGKSSILQALALTLMGQQHANELGLDARRFVRRDVEVNKGEVVVDVSGVGRIRMEFSLDSEQFRINPPDPKVLLLGYGATRLLPKAVRRESSQQTAIRILNLFDPTAPLADTEAWLMDRERVSDAQLDEFAEDLSRLLMLPDEMRLCRDEGLIEVEYGGMRKVLRDMSDGFQSIIALAGDIAIGVRDWWGGLREAEGVVLLDEIEVHLHPTWKISIVERLRQTCPMLSFVVTTHDPLCLKGLRPEEIVVMRRTPEESIELITDIPQIQHLRSDEVLSSFLFDLPSTRGSGSSVAVARYATLLGKSDRSVGEQEELRELEAKLEQQFSNTASPMQREVEKVLRDAMVTPLSTSGSGEGAVSSANSLSPQELEMRRQLSEMLRLEEEDVR
jgi:hypothetical protein